MSKSRQPRDPGKADVSVRVQMQDVPSRKNIILLGGRVRHFVLFRLSADWMRPSHIGEGNIFYYLFKR